MSTALDRIKSALAACPHGRGKNGTMRRVKMANRVVTALVNPCVELVAADLAELARSVIGERVAGREQADEQQHAAWDTEDAATKARHEKEILSSTPEAIDGLLREHVAERKAIGEARDRQREATQAQRVRENLISGQRIPMDLHTGASEIAEFGRQGQTVHVHVDDAWHLVDAAEAAELARSTLAKKVPAT